MLVLVVIALLLPAIFDLATGVRQGRSHALPVSNEELSLATPWFVNLRRPDFSTWMMPLITTCDAMAPRW